MEFSPFIGVIAVFVLVLANGFFVATEFAVVAVRQSRLAQLVEEGRAGASAAQADVGQLDSYIAATQFGITLASLALGWIGEPALAGLIEPPLAYVVGTFAPAAAHGVAIAIAFSFITGLHIVIGELAPKGLALARPEATTLWVARPIQVFHAIFKWPISALNTVGNATLRLFGFAPADARVGIDTLGGLLTSLLGRFPAIGENIVVEGRVLRVEARDGLRISSVRLLPRRESTAA